MQSFSCIYLKQQINLAHALACCALSGGIVHWVSRDTTWQAKALLPSKHHMRCTIQKMYTYLSTRVLSTVWALVNNIVDMTALHANRAVCERPSLLLLLVWLMYAEL